MNKQIVSTVVKLALVAAFLVMSNAAWAARESYIFNIPSQSLELSLKQFGAVTNQQLLYSRNLVAGLEGNAVVGDFPAFEALSKLLEGTGLVSEMTSSDVALIKARENSKYTGDTLVAQVEQSNRAIDAGSGATVLETKQSIAIARAEPSRPAIEQVTITAQRREQNIQEVGVAVTTFSGANIRSLGMRRPEDIAAQTPNLDVKNALGNYNPIFTIRGIGLNDVNINNNPSVGGYVDEISMPNGGYMAFSLFDVERIEVLMGPQGTLFGRNTSAGAVLFTTARPSDEFEAFLDVDYGSYNSLKVEGVVSGELSSTLNARLAFATNHSDGYFTNNGTTVTGGLIGPRASFFDNTLGADQPPAADVLPPNPVVEKNKKFFRQENYSLRASFDWMPSDSLDLFLTAHFTADQSNNQPRSMSPESVDLNGFSPVDNDPYTVDSNIDPEVDIESFGAALHVNWEMDKVVLALITGYENLDRDIPFDESSPWRILDQVFREKAEFFSQELRFSSNNEGALFWTVGAYYSHEVVDGFKSVSGLDGIVRSIINTDYVQDGDSYAIFGQLEYHLNDALNLTFGVRYTDDKKRYAGGTFTDDLYGVDLTQEILLRPPEVLPLFGDNSLKEDDVSGKVALDWAINNNVMIYGSVSKGYKSGGFDGSSITRNSSFMPFLGETVYAYEMGIKSGLFEDSVRFNIAMFLYDYRNMQGETLVEIAPDIFESIRSNVGTGKIYGLDFDLRWVPAEGWDVKIGLGYVHTEITKYVSEDPDDVESFTGNELADSPHLTLNGLVSYTMSLGNFLSGTMQFDANYVGETFKDFANSEHLKADSYWLFNARLALVSEGNGWETAFYVKNIGNNRYLRQRFENFGPGWIYETYGAPRTWGINARKYF